jgi:hypothetical protein
VAVSFVGASASGNSANVLSVGTAVPAGVAAGDVAVAFLESWQDATPPTVTPPTGFAQKGATWSSSDGLAVNSVWWKRLTGADSGTYTFTLGSGRWNTLQLLVFRGCATSGDPFDAVATPVAGTFGSITSMSLTVTDGGGAQVFTVYNDSSGTHTPPTGFTEPAAVDVDCAACAYKLNGGATGSVTVSGASISSSSSAGAWAGALLSDAGGGATAKSPPRLGQISQIRTILAR